MQVHTPLADNIKDDAIDCFYDVLQLFSERFRMQIQQLCQPLHIFRPRRLARNVRQARGLTTMRNKL